MVYLNIKQYGLVAHRGLHDNDGGVPENSMAAFARAVERGHGIELDVRLTADRELVVFHDAGTLRMTGTDVDIAATPYIKLARMKLLDTGCNIPTIQDALELVAGRVPVVIELKTAGRSGLAEAVLQRVLKYYRGEYAIESFNHHTVEWYKKNYPDITRGQLGCGGRDDSFEPAALSKRWLRRTNPHFIAYDINALTPELSDFWHEQGRYVVGWTVKTEAQLAKAKALCDSIIYEGLAL